jgi:hypothetical protein
VTAESLDSSSECFECHSHRLPAGVHEPRFCNSEIPGDDGGATNAYRTHNQSYSCRSRIAGRFGRRPSTSDPGSPRRGPREGQGSFSFWKRYLAAFAAMT